MQVRLENSAEHEAIRHINLTSFPKMSEAGLVDRLRSDGDAVYSLVAVKDGAIVGHAMFSRMSAPFRALGLAPVGVLPVFRRQGVAACLIKEGMRFARKDNWDGIFVLGDTAHYRKFGFRAELTRGFSSPYAGPHFMALSLNGEALPAATGEVDYAPAFSDLT